MAATIREVAAYSEVDENLGRTGNRRPCGGSTLVILQDGKGLDVRSTIPSKVMSTNQEMPGGVMDDQDRDLDVGRSCANRTRARRSVSRRSRRCDAAGSKDRELKAKELPTQNEFPAQKWSLGEASPDFAYLLTSRQRRLNCGVTHNRRSNGRQDSAWLSWKSCSRADAEGCDSDE
jgi:hypothetical protein